MAIDMVVSYSKWRKIIPISRSVSIFDAGRSRGVHNACGIAPVRNRKLLLARDQSFIA